MVCIARPHCANIAMIVAGTSSQTRKLHVNQTRVEVSVLQKSWWCGMCSSRNCSVPNVVVSVTKAMSGSVTKTLVDGFHHANHHLSKRASQILVVLWRKPRQRPPNPSFNALHYHVLKHTVRERPWSGWQVTLWNLCPLCSSSANRLLVCAQCVVGRPLMKRQD